MDSTPSDEAVCQLLDMGFPLDKVQLALRSSNQDLNEAMEWLLVHATGDDNEAVPMEAVVDAQPTEAVREDAGRDPRPVSVEAVSDTPQAQEGAKEDEGGAEAEPAEGADGSNDPGLVAKALKCDECGKLFDNADEANFHAVKTKHSSFSESTEEKKPLTEEERKEQMEKLQERLKQRRLEREQKEKEEALDREKNRIKVGKEISEVRRKHEEVEMRKIADERKREKMEEKLARQRVLDQIARDKEARALKQQGLPAEPTPAPIAQPVASVAATSSGDKKQYDKTRLQLRLPSGRVLTETFGAKEPLASVRLYVANQDQAENPTNITLMTSFPKKVFGTDDWEMPLDALDLVPSAVLIVKYN